MSEKSRWNPPTLKWRGGQNDDQPSRPLQLRACIELPHPLKQDERGAQLLTDHDEYMNLLASSSSLLIALHTRGNQSWLMMHGECKSFAELNELIEEMLIRGEWKQWCGDGGQEIAEVHFSDFRQSSWSRPDPLNQSWSLMRAWKEPSLLWSNLVGAERMNAALHELAVKMAEAGIPSQKSRDLDKGSEGLDLDDAGPTLS